LRHWWWHIGVGASLEWRQLCNSKTFSGEYCRVVGIGALVGRWCCHSIGAGAPVSDGRDLTINLRGGRRGVGAGGRAMRSTTRSVGNNGGPTVTTLSDLSTLCCHRRHHQQGGANANARQNCGHGCDDTCNAVADTEGEGTLSLADVTAQEAERSNQNALGGARGVNSLTAKSILAGEKLILFGRYIINFYIGIVHCILHEMKTWRAKIYLPTQCINRQILTSTKQI
jgi:hypothetical protein